MRINILLLLACVFLLQTAQSQISFSSEILIDQMDYYTLKDIDIMDMDMDGDNDIVYIQSDNDELGWFENNGDHTFQRHILSYQHDYPNGLVTGDWDNDGDNDIVVGSSTDGEFAWFENDGTGNFSGQQIIDIGNMSAPRCMSDLNKDGHMDIVGATYVGINDGSGNFTYSNYLIKYCVDVVDVNGDTYPDIVHGYDNEIKVAINNGSGGFPAAGSQPVVATPDECRDLLACDLNGDTYIDILYNDHYENSVVWLANDGAGNFSLPQVITTTVDYVLGLDAGDIDNDGDIDVFACSVSDHEVVWFENGGTGNFGGANIIGTGVTHVNFVTVGDLDEDTDLDVLTFARVYNTTWEFEDLIMFEAYIFPNFYVQPDDNDVCVGEDAQFSFVVDNSTSIEWQVDEGSGFVPVVDNFMYSGSNTNTLSITDTEYSMNGHQYRCLVYNSGFFSYTDTVTLILNELPVANFSSTSPILTDESSTIEYIGTASEVAVFDWDFDGATISPTGPGPHTISWPNCGEKNVSLTITDLNGCVSAQNTQIVEVKPTADFNLPLQACVNEPVEIIYTGLGTSAGTYMWDLDFGLIINGASPDPVDATWSTPGWKFVNLIVQENGVTSDVYTDSILIHPTPVVELGSDINLFMGEEVILNANITGGTPPFADYSWSTTENGTSITVSPTDTTMYYFYVTDYYGCVGMDSVTVNVFTIYQDQELCLVTVDPSVGKNKIMWEKIPGLGIESFYVYKELASNVYGLIGIVPFNDPSIFIDYASDPASHGDKYKITIYDESGFESQIDSCAFHKTINLTLSNVGSTMALNWDYYEVEDNSFIPPKYYIYRGENLASMELLDSVSGSFNSYNDNGVYEVYHYMVGAVRESCGSGSKTSYTSLSNSEDNEDLIISLKENNSYLPLSIYPNPANEKVYISIPEKEKGTIILRITDITGKELQIYQVEGSSGKFEIDISGYSQGLYFIELTGEKQYKEKIIIQ